MRDLHRDRVGIAAYTAPLPNNSATRARMPEPVPTSSTAMPGRQWSSNASMQSWVVGCTPVPKAIPGFTGMRNLPAGAGSSRHSGTRKKRFPISIGWRRSRASCTQSLVLFDAQRRTRVHAEQRLTIGAVFEECADVGAFGFGDTGRPLLPQFGDEKVAIVGIAIDFEREHSAPVMVS